MNKKIWYAVIMVVSLSLIAMIPAQSQANPALDALVQQVIDLNLQEGISNSLDAKLDTVLQALNDINENGVKHPLRERRNANIEHPASRIQL